MKRTYLMIEIPSDLVGAAGCLTTAATARGNKKLTLHLSSSGEDSVSLMCTPLYVELRELKLSSDGAILFEPPSLAELTKKR